MNKDTAEFAVYVINAVAKMRNLATHTVYTVLDKSGCLENYLVECYDVLHTMGTEAIANDVIKYVERRGFVL